MMCEVFYRLPLIQKNTSKETLNWFNKFSTSELRTRKKQQSKSGESLRKSWSYMNMQHIELMQLIINIKNNSIEYIVLIYFSRFEKIFQIHRACDKNQVHSRQKHIEAVVGFCINVDSANVIQKDILRFYSDRVTFIV